MGVETRSHAVRRDCTRCRSEREEYKSDGRSRRVRAARSLRGRQSRRKQFQPHPLEGDKRGDDSLSWNRARLWTGVAAGTIVAGWRWGGGVMSMTGETD